MRLQPTELNRLAAIGMAQYRWWGSDLKEILRKRGLGQDVIQSLYLAAVEAWRDGLNPDAQADTREMRRRAYRAIYACLRSYGFRRPFKSPKMVWSDMPCAYLGGARNGINPNREEWYR